MDIGNVDHPFWDSKKLKNLFSVESGKQRKVLWSKYYIPWAHKTRDLPLDLH